MKLIQVVSIFFVFSQVLAESEYNYYQTQHDQHQVDPYAGYSNDLNAGYTSAVSERQDFDMDVILPIVVFGGLGLGALAYIDSLNRQNNLCNKLREVTNAMRTAAAGGANAVTIANPANVAQANAVTGLANANTVINSNRLFINSLANIQNLDC